MLKVELESLHARNNQHAPQEQVSRTSSGGLRWATQVAYGMFFLST